MIDFGAKTIWLRTVFSTLNNFILTTTQIECIKTTRCYKIYCHLIYDIVLEICILVYSIILKSTVTLPTCPGHYWKADSSGCCIRDFDFICASEFNMTIISLVVHSNNINILYYSFDLIILYFRHRICMI